MRSRSARALLQRGGGLVAAEPRGELVERLLEVAAVVGDEVLTAGAPPAPITRTSLACAGRLDQAADEPAVAQLVAEAAAADVLEHAASSSGRASESKQLAAPGPEQLGERSSSAGE